MRFLLIPVIGIILYGCNQQPESLGPTAYQEWLFSKKSRLNKEKSINNVKLNARYHPAEYLAYKEYINSTNEGLSYDSVLQFYNCGITFQLILSAPKNDAKYGSLNFYNIKSQEELTARIQELSFHAENFISIEFGGSKYSPVLNNFEGFDELGNKVGFMFVFQIPNNKCEITEDITLVFDDPFWDLGTNKFLFEKKNIESLPRLKL